MDEPRNSQQQQQQQELDVVDRISDLPDFILGQILSFLPTLDAVATSILSKRWKSTWLLLRNLDFYYSGSNDLEMDSDSAKFIDFVYRILFLNNFPMLNKFSLEWSSLHPDAVLHFASSWLKTAIARNIQEISLDLSCAEQFNVPSCVFSCASLRCFETIGWSGISLPTSFVVSLPRLNKLKLTGVESITKEDFEKLIIGCPLLHDLELPLYGFGWTYIISSTSLRRLFIHCVYPYTLKLEAPSLEYLKLDGVHVPVQFVCTSLSSCVEVDFAIAPWDKESRIVSGIESGDFPPNDSIVKAIGVFDCANSLILSADTMEALSRSTVKLSTKFNNLVKLKAYVGDYDWGSLHELFQLSDNLQFLTIHQDLDSEEIDRCGRFKWTSPPAEVPMCLSKSLKEVVFDGYHGDLEDENEVIQYILKHGSVLEALKITVVGQMNISKFKALRKILEYPRKSTFCVVKFFALKSCNNV